MQWEKSMQKVTKMTPQSLSAESFQHSTHDDFYFFASGLDAAFSFRISTPQFMDEDKLPQTGPGNKEERSIEIQM
jgi:hypothetical protein